MDYNHVSPPDGPAAAAYYQNSLQMSVTSHNIYSPHGRSNASSSAGVPVIPPVHFSNDTEKHAKLFANIFLAIPFQSLSSC